MDRMKLTRRDALKALAAGGVAGAGGLAASEALVRTELSRADPSLSEEDFTTLEAVADTIYPSQVEVTREFIETYVGSLREGRKESMARAAAQLNDFTRSRYGAVFYELSSSARDVSLRTLGVDRAISRPDGNRAERIRYHIVNGLLYALFTTPRGSRLVGIENPDGYPGGFAVYARKR